MVEGAVETTLRVYPAYRDSGVPWIGEIPEGWTLKKIKGLCKLDNGFVFPPDSWSTEGTPIIRIENFKEKERYNYSQADVPERHHVKHGDLLFAWSATLGPFVWDAPGEYFLNQHIFKVTSKENQKWLYYSLLAGTEALKLQMHGSAMTHITRSKLDNTALAFPPIIEQHAIADFLDHETARIDELLLEQEGLLDDLVVKRQATVVQAVFKGLLEGGVSQKDSGVPSLGEIPQHWEVSPLKRILLSLEQGWSPECENRNADAGEWGVLKLSSVTGGIFKADENKALPTHLEPLPGLNLRKGDILVTRANTRALVGAAAMVGDDFNELMISDLIYRLRVDQDRCLPAYLTWILQSPVGRSVIELNANGTSHSMVKIPRGVLNNMMVPLPPLAEQQAITDHLDRVLAQLDQLVSEVRASMELMRQHRFALITAAITGKIDVRETHVPSPVGAG